MPPKIHRKTKQSIETLQKWGDPWWAAEPSKKGTRPISSFLLSIEGNSRNQIERTGFWYELLSRKARRYLLEKPFDKLPDGAIWFLRDGLEGKAFKTICASPLVNADEVAAIQSDAGLSDEIGGNWTTPYCFNLDHTDSEIEEYVRKKLSELRRSSKKSHSDKGPPWRFVGALERYSSTEKGKTVLPKEYKLGALKLIAQWRAENQYVLEEICMSWRRVNGEQSGDLLAWWQYITAEG